MISILDNILSEVHPLIVLIVGLMLNWLLIFIFSLIEDIQEKPNQIRAYILIRDRLRSGKLKSEFSKYLAIFLIVYFPLLIMFVILQIIFMIYHAGE